MKISQPRKTAIGYTKLTSMVYKNLVPMVSLNRYQYIKSNKKINNGLNIIIPRIDFMFIRLILPIREQHTYLNYIDLVFNPIFVNRNVLGFILNSKYFDIVHD